MPKVPVRRPRMPDKLIVEAANSREALAIILALCVGFVARTLASDEPFNLKKFIGEMILSGMLGAAIYVFGIVQSVGYWETLLVALLTGMGTTRTMEWVITAFKSIPKSGG